MDTSEKAPREFYITIEDAKKHKYTRGCGGCTSFNRGLGRQPHTVECRERFRNLMREEAKVINSEERRNSSEAREKEKRRKREEKKRRRRKGRRENKKMTKEEEKKRWNKGALWKNNRLPVLRGLPEEERRGR